MNPYMLGGSRVILGTLPRRRASDLLRLWCEEFGPRHDFVDIESTMEATMEAAMEESR